MIDISVIIVSWNVSELLDKCLQSLLASATPNMEIIVVDSASHDDTVAMIQSRYPQIELLAQSSNVGFTRGNNLGLEAASGRYVLLLNPDTEVLGDAVAQMTRYLDQHPTVGIVGPHTLNTDGTHQSTRRRFPTRALAFLESTWLQPLAPAGMMSDYYVQDQPDDATIAVDWVQGSCLMARREVYDQIGGLDTGYVMYWEELDWCRRARDAGWEVAYLGSAQIIHHGGKSSDQASARKHIHFQESKLRYFRKFHGRLFAHGLQVFLLISYGWQFGLESLKWLLGHKRAIRRERISTYWQVIRSGLKVS